MTTGSQSFNKHLRPALLLLLKLLFLHFSVKLLFFLVNFSSSGGFDNILFHDVFQLAGFAILNDLFVMMAINLPLFLLFSVAPIKKFPRFSWYVAVLFMLINLAALMLNIFDVFYFHFHYQRANADLLYVTQHLVQKTLVTHPWLSLLIVFFSTVLLFILYRFFRVFYASYVKEGHVGYATLATAVFFSLLFMSFRGMYMPTYPLLSVPGRQLPFVQNSFHTFLYSVYRNRDGSVKPVSYMDNDLARKFVPSLKYPSLHDSVEHKRNIVLFIMESIPEDFFDDKGKYKVTMPFFDSIRSKGMYFSNAYSYSHNSNKGIVAILAGMPTITEIPLYHSSYTGLPVTRIGSRLADLGYRSMFFIGDDFDDFGFAKCVNWLGFQSYYSKEKIPGYRKMESHTMGLHDEYVLDFVQSEINNSTRPFLAVHYNTSTHYPNDLPKKYVEKFPAVHFSDQMKSMSYYNECLETFFKTSSSKPWFNETVFIFCSDHWMYPDTRSPISDVLQSFRIPVLIYEPGNPKRMQVEAPVSQLDIMNTILDIAGNKKPFLSYGESLLNESRSSNRVVFTRENSTLYQALDSSYVLGFNIVTGKPEFCYNHLEDPHRKHNLALQPNKQVDILTMYMKAFLQNVTEQHLSSGSSLKVEKP